MIVTDGVSAKAAATKLKAGIKDVVNGDEIVDSTNDASQNESSGRVKVTIMAGRHLPRADKKSSDPFVELSLGNQTFTTSTKMKNLNPVWQEEFEFIVPDWNTLLSTEVNIAVYDWDLVGGNDLMCTTTLGDFGTFNGDPIRMEGYNPRQPVVGREESRTLQLTNRTNGKDKNQPGGMLSVRLCVFGFPVEAPDGTSGSIKSMHGIDEETRNRQLAKLAKNFSPSVSSLRGTCNCFLVGGNDLPRADKTSSDPFVEFNLVYTGQNTVNKRRKQCFKSSKKKKKLNPNWDENFVFEFEDWDSLSNSYIEVKVYDWDRIGRNKLMGTASIIGLDFIAGKQLRAGGPESFDRTEPLVGVNDVRVIQLENHTTGVDKDEPGGEISVKLRVEGFPTKKQVSEALRSIRLAEAKERREAKRKEDAEFARNLIALSEKSQGFKMLRNFRKEVEKRKQANIDLAWELKLETEGQQKQILENERAVRDNYGDMIERLNPDKFHWSLKDVLVECLIEKKAPSVEMLKQYFIDRESIGMRYQDMYEKGRTRTEHLKVLADLEKEKLNRKNRIRFSKVAAEDGEDSGEDCGEDDAGRELHEDRKEVDDLEQKSGEAEEVEGDPKIAAAKIALLEAQEAEDEEAIEEAKKVFETLGVPVPGELTLAQIYGRTEEEQLRWEEKTAIRFLGGMNKNYYCVKQLVSRSLRRKTNITIKWMKREKRKIDREESRKKTEAKQKERQRLKLVQTEKKQRHEKLRRARKKLIRRALGETEEEAEQDSYDEYSASGSDIEDILADAQAVALSAKDNLIQLYEEFHAVQLSLHDTVESIEGPSLDEDVVTLQNQMKSKLLKHDIEAAEGNLKTVETKLHKIWLANKKLDSSVDESKRLSKDGDEDEDKNDETYLNLRSENNDDDEVAIGQSKEPHNGNENKRNENEEKIDAQFHEDQNQSDLCNDGNESIKDIDKVPKDHKNTQDVIRNLSGIPSTDYTNMYVSKPREKKRITKRRRRRKKRGRFAKIATHVGGTKYAHVERVIVGRLKKIKESDKYKALLEKAAEAKAKAKQKAIEVNLRAKAAAAEAKRLAEEKRKAMRDSETYKAAIAKAKKTRALAKQKAAERAHASYKKSKEAKHVARIKKITSAKDKALRKESKADTKKLKNLQNAVQNIEKKREQTRLQLNLLNAEPTKEEKLDEELELDAMEEEDKTAYIEQKLIEKAEENEELKARIDSFDEEMISAKKCIDTFIATCTARDKKRQEEEAAIAAKKAEEAALSGRLKLEILRVSSLPSVNDKILANPFVEIKYKPNLNEESLSESKNKPKDDIRDVQEFRTKILTDTTNPEYNETFVLHIKDWDALCAGKIEIHIWDWDMINKNKLLCTAVIEDLSFLMSEERLPIKSNDADKDEPVLDILDTRTIEFHNSESTSSEMNNKNANADLKIGVPENDTDEADSENNNISDEVKNADEKAKMYVNLTVFGFPMSQYNKVMGISEENPEVETKHESDKHVVALDIDEADTNMSAVKKSTEIHDKLLLELNSAKQMMDAANENLEAQKCNRIAKESLLEEATKLLETLEDEEERRDQQNCIEDLKTDLLSLIESEESKSEIVKRTKSELVLAEAALAAEVDAQKSTQSLYTLNTSLAKSKESKSSLFWEKVQNKFKNGRRRGVTTIKLRNETPLIKAIRAKMKIVREHERVIKLQKKMKEAVAQMQNKAITKLQNTTAARHAHTAKQITLAAHQAFIQSNAYKSTKEKALRIKKHLNDPEKRAEMKAKLEDKRRILKERTAKLKQMLQEKKEFTMAKAVELKKQMEDRKLRLAAMGKEERKAFLANEKAEKKANRLKREVEDEKLLEEEKQRKDAEEWKLMQMTEEEQMIHKATLEEEKKIKLEAMSTNERQSYLYEEQQKKQRLRKAKMWVKVRRHRRNLETRVSRFKETILSLRDAEKRALLLDEMRDRMADAAEKKKLDLIIKARQAKELATNKEKRKELKLLAKKRMREAKEKAMDKDTRQQGFNVLAKLKTKLYKKASQAKKAAMATKAAKKAMEKLEQAQKSETYQKALAAAEAAKKKAMESSVMQNAMNSEAMQAALKYKENAKLDTQFRKKESLSVRLKNMAKNNMATEALSKQVFKIKKKAVSLKADIDRAAEERGLKVIVDWKEDPIGASKHITRQTRAIIEKKYEWSKKYRQRVSTLQYKVRILLAMRKLNLLRRDHQKRMESADWIIAQYRLRLTRRLIAKSRHQKNVMAKRIQRLAMIFLGKLLHIRLFSIREKAVVCIQTRVRVFLARPFLMRWKQRKQFQNCVFPGSRIFLRSCDGCYVQPEALTRRMIAKPPKEQRSFFCRFSVGTCYRRYRHSSSIVLNGDPISFKSHRKSYISSAPKIFGRSGVERRGCPRGGIFDKRFSSGVHFDYKTMQTTKVLTAAKYLEWDQPGDGQLWRIYKDPAERHSQPQIVSGDLVLLINEESREALSCENGVLGTIPLTRGAKYWCYFNIIIEGYEKTGDGRILVSKANLTASLVNEMKLAKMPGTTTFRKRLFRMERSLQPFVRSKSFIALENARTNPGIHDKRDEEARRALREARDTFDKTLPTLFLGASRTCSICIFSDGTVEVCSFGIDTETQKQARLQKEFQESLEVVTEDTKKANESNEWISLRDAWEKARSDVASHTKSIKNSRKYKDFIFNLSVAQTDLETLHEEETKANARILHLKRAVGNSTKKSRSVLRKEAREDKLKSERATKRAELQKIMKESKAAMVNMVEGGSAVNILADKVQTCFEQVNEYMCAHLLGVNRIMDEYYDRAKIHAEWLEKSLKHTKTMKFEIDRIGINYEYGCKEIAESIVYAAPTVGFDGGFYIPKKYQISDSSRHVIAPLASQCILGKILSDGSLQLTGIREQWSQEVFLDSNSVRKAAVCLQWNPQEKKKRKKRRKKKRNGRNGKNKSPRSRKHSTDISTVSTTSSTPESISPIHSPEIPKKSAIIPIIPSKEELKCWSLIEGAIDAQSKDKDGAGKKLTLDQLRRIQLAKVFVSEGWWETYAILALERMGDNIESAREYLLNGHAKDYYIATEAIRWGMSRINSRSFEDRWRDPHLEAWKNKSPWDQRHVAWLQRTARLRPVQLPKWVWRLHPEWNWLRYGWSENLLTQSAYAATEERRNHLVAEAAAAEAAKNAPKVPGLDMSSVGRYDENGNWVEGGEELGYYDEYGNFIEINTEGQLDSVPDGEGGEYFVNMTVDGFWESENMWYEADIVRLFEDRCSIKWHIDDSVSDDIPYSFIRPFKEGSKEQRQTDALTELGQRYSW